MSSKSKGIVCIVASAFCFAMMNAFVRAAGELPTMQKMFFRNVVALFVAAVVLARSGTGFKTKREYIPSLLLRAFFGTVGIFCNFYAIDHLILSDASILNKLSPFFAVLGSTIILREKLKPYQAAAVMTAFIGALFVIKPAGSFMNTASLIGALGGFGAGMAYTMVRRLSSMGERGPFIVFFFSAFSTLASLPYLIFSYHHMSLYQLCILLCAGISATGGQFTITAAYSFAPASEISVFDYTQIVFAAAIGFFAFGDVPDIWSIIGYVIIASVSVAMFLMKDR